MRVFLQKLFWLVSALLIINVCCHFINIWLLDKQVHEISGSETVFVGDSHIVTSIIPEQLDKTLNLATTGELYFVTYYKIRKLLEEGDGAITRVIIGYSYHNLSSFYDEMPSNDRWFRTQFRDVYSFIPVWKIASLDQVAISGLVTSAYKEHYFTLKSVNPHFVSGWDGRPYRLDKADLEYRIDQQYYSYGTVRSKDSMQIFWRSRIIEVCLEHHTKPILMTTPLRPEYRNRVPDSFRSIKDSLAAIYLAQGASYYDYAALTLADSMWYDYNHLNQYGAADFTSRIKGVLSSDDQVNAQDGGRRGILCRVWSAQRKWGRYVAKSHGSQVYRKELGK